MAVKSIMYNRSIGLDYFMHRVIYDMTWEGLKGPPFDHQVPCWGALEIRRWGTCVMAHTTCVSASAIYTNNFLYLFSTNEFRSPRVIARMRQNKTKPKIWDRAQRDAARCCKSD